MSTKQVDARVLAEVKILNGVTRVLRLVGMFGYQYELAMRRNQRRNILKRNSRKETENAKDRRSRKENDERGK